nr:MAG TPA: hypothetical protein [Caudoviricetes sp.]
MFLNPFCGIRLEYVIIYEGNYNPSFLMVSMPIRNISVVPILPRRPSTNSISSASSSFRRFT